MVTVLGTFKDGYVKLDREYSSDTPVKVIVIFLEDIKSSSVKNLSLSDFSFAKSQENLENYKGSLSDAVVEERRSEL